MDKHTPDFWRSIKPGDIVQLSDLRTIEISRKAGKGMDGLDYAVSSILRIKQENDLVEWRFFELEVSEEEERESLSLVAKIVDDKVSIAALEPLGIEPGSREELLDREMLFLFQPPEDEDDFDPDDLKFSAELIPEDEASFGWFQKPQGELYGEADYIPPRSGIDKQAATVVEYGARAWRPAQDADWQDKEDQNEFDEVYIVERGTDGSYVEFFGSWLLSFGDVAVMKK